MERHTSVICLLQLRSWVCAQYGLLSGLAAWGPFSRGAGEAGCLFPCGLSYSSFWIQGKDIN